MSLPPLSSVGSKDLRRERSFVSFPVNLMTRTIYGSEEEVQRRKYLDKLVGEDLELNPSELPFLTHGERFIKSLQNTKRLLEIRKEQNLPPSDLGHLFVSSGEWHALTLHEVFLSSLANLGDASQVEKYYKKAENYEIIGCYCQTELAHGSNVKDIKTTATYDPQTDSFDLHSPSIEACKWWVGALGKSATHAILFARLILPSGDQGVHPFIVQLRDLKSHQLLPGIIAGDIGPKMGFSGVDNGFLMLNHVKIPRSDLLAKFGKVLPGGKYESPPHAKLAYAGMTATRVGLAVSAGIYLARACTIAIRYSIIRRQGGDYGKEENQILNYSVQQHRLFTQLANAFALHFSGDQLMQLHEQFKESAAKGKVNIDLLQELHAASSGLKSANSTIGSGGIEDCRKCCGGHGFSHASGLPDLFSNYVAVCTAEGDNFILTQQTTRYLVKCFQKSREGNFKPSSPLLNYMTKSSDQLEKERFPLTCLNCVGDVKYQIAAFEHRAARAVSNVSEKIQASLSSGKSPDQAWNSALVEIYRASMAHCLLIILSSFIQVVEKSKDVPSVHAALKRLCDLFFCHHVEEGLADFLEDGYMTSDQAKKIREKSRNLIEEIRRDAIGYVDAWEIPDHTLNSVIGKKDGNVYLDLFNWAQKEPLNQKDVANGVMEYLQPLVDGHLSKL